MNVDFQPVIVVPVFNHGAVFERTLASLGEFNLPIVAVDDGSDAETRAILTHLASEHAELTLLQHPTNQGKGGAVMTGIRFAAARGFSHVLQIDADGQHDVADIPEFLTLGHAEPEAVIIGQPVFDESIPTARRIGRKLTHFWIRIETLSFDITDSMCGFRLYPVKSVLPLLSNPTLGRSMDFDPEILVRLHWQGTPIREHPTRVIYPAGGRSNFRAFSDNALISLMHTRLVFGMLWRSPLLLSRRLSRPDHADHWAGIAERGSLLGLRFMLAVYSIFGRWLFRPIAAIVVSYFALTSRTAREASREFLARVWAQDSPALQRPPDLWTSLHHFYNFAEAALDKIAAWQGDIRYDQIDHENIELFESRVRAGAGAVWVTSHLGNIEVCRAIGREALEVRLTVLMHTRHAENFNRLLQEVAPESNVELMEVSAFNMATAMRLKERINAGRFIVIVGDRTPIGEKGRVVTCNFLGRPASFPSGPYLLALLLDCPAGTLFCVREGGRFRLMIDDLPNLRQVPRRARPEAIQLAAETYAARLERLCLRYPLQWFNFFPFWDLRNEANQD